MRLTLVIIFYRGLGELRFFLQQPRLVLPEWWVQHDNSNICLDATHLDIPSVCNISCIVTRTNAKRTIISNFSSSHPSLESVSILHSIQTTSWAIFYFPLPIQAYQNVLRFIILGGSLAGTCHPPLSVPSLRSDRRVLSAVDIMR